MSQQVPHNRCVSHVALRTTIATAGTHITRVVICSPPAGATGIHDMIFVQPLCTLITPTMGFMTSVLAREDVDILLASESLGYVWRPPTAHRLPLSDRSADQPPPWKQRSSYTRMLRTTMWTLARQWMFILGRAFHLSFTGRRAFVLRTALKFATLASPLCSP